MGEIEWVWLKMGGLNKTRGFCLEWVGWLIMGENEWVWLKKKIKMGGLISNG